MNKERIEFLRKKVNYFHVKIEKDPRAIDEMTIELIEDYKK